MRFMYPTNFCTFFHLTLRKAQNLLANLSLYQWSTMVSYPLFQTFFCYPIKLKYHVSAAEHVTSAYLFFLID